VPPLLNNGIDLRKRRLTIEAESGSLTDRKPHHDEKGGGLDLGALAKELAVQVDDLKNEGKRIEQENEAKRMEWVWLDLVRHSLLPPSMTAPRHMCASSADGECRQQERVKMEQALKDLKQELEERQQARTVLELRLPSAHPAYTHALAGTGRAGRGEPEAEDRERAPAPTRQVQV
jgi:hypothetical protein